MYRYLTNQVWIVGIVSKIFIVLELLRWRKSEDQERVSLAGWCTSLLFLVLGCAQFGILAAFFLLVWLDSTLLDKMLENQQHTLAEIIAWNHLRHVTVCFLHIVTLWSLRHYLSRNAETSQPIRLLSKGECTLNFSVFCALLLVMPLAIGLLHSLFFDDKELYKFGSTDIGSKCQFAFAVFSVAAGIYFLCVPLRSSWLERKSKDPDGIIPVTPPVPPAGLFSTLQKSSTTEYTENEDDVTNNNIGKNWRNAFQ